MGSHFTFTAVSADDSLAWRAMRAGMGEVQRIDRLMSYWDSTSQITQVNRAGGRAAGGRVGRKVYDLIQRTLKALGPQRRGLRHHLRRRRQDLQVRPAGARGPARLGHGAGLGAAHRLPKVRARPGHALRDAARKGHAHQPGGHPAGLRRAPGPGADEQMGIAGGLINGSGDVLVLGPAGRRLAAGALPSATRPSPRTCRRG